MDVQDGGAGVVAIHRLLDLIVPTDRDILGEIARDPRRPPGRCGDDQRVLILR